MGIASAGIYGGAALLGGGAAAATGWKAIRWACLGINTICILAYAAACWLLLRRRAIPA
jgi:hypothetical protein